MDHKKNIIEFFGKFFLDKKEEPRSTKEEEYIYDWYTRHNDIFEDEYKRYFLLSKTTFGIFLDFLIHHQLHL